MILHVPAGSPSWMFAAANALLALHIGGGVAGVASGGVALAARKGSGLHQQAGTVFLVSMFVMAGIGAAVAPFLPQRPSIVAGLLTLYLVFSGWLTAKRKPGTTGALEFANLALAFSAIAIALFLLQTAANTPTHQIDGEPAAPLWIFAAVGTIAVAGDLKLLMRGGISGAQRLARHLWRMCVALFIAAASFFLGQQKLMPALLRGSPLLFVLAFAPLLVMAFWMVRVRIAGAYRALTNNRIGFDKRLKPV